MVITSTMRGCMDELIVFHLSELSRKRRALGTRLHGDKQERKQTRVLQFRKKGVKKLFPRHASFVH